MSNLLHLTVIGKGAPLVLLHGWGWHSGIWSPLVPHLADKFQLFIPDLPGFGKSPDLTKNYTFDEIASNLFEIVPEKAAWLGWSLGGMLAWWVSVNYPERVTQLVTVAAAPKFTGDENWPGVPLSVLNQFSTRLINQYEETLSDFLLLQLRGSSENQALLAELKTQFSPMKTTALMGGLRLLCETDLRTDLSRIKIPSLHVFGGMDTLVPASVIASLKPLLVDGQCALIKRAGHIPFLSHTNEFLKLLLKNFSYE